MILVEHGHIVVLDGRPAVVAKGHFVGKVVVLGLSEIRGLKRRQRRVQSLEKVTDDGDILVELHATVDAGPRGLVAD